MINEKHGTTDFADYTDNYIFLSVKSVVAFSFWGETLKF